MPRRERKSYSEKVTRMMDEYQELLKLSKLGNVIILHSRLQEHALIEGVAWPPQLNFWVRRRCYKDFAAYVGRTMRLRLEEETIVHILVVTNRT